MTLVTPSGQPTPLLEGEFRSQSVGPATRFITADVPAPTEVYVSVDDFLRVTIQNVAGAGLSVTLNYHMIRAVDGVPYIGQAVLSAPNGGALTVFTIPLTEGFLLSVAVSAGNISLLQRGAYFVQVQVCTGNTADLRIDQTLIQDYLTSNYSLAWPGGMLRTSVEGPGNTVVAAVGNPAAGAEMTTLTTTTPEKQRLVYVRMTLTTNATVANRQPAFILSDAGGTEMYRVGIVGSIVASTVATICLGTGIGAPSVNNNIHVLPVSEDTFLRPQASITSLTAGLQAGDQYSNITWTTERWLQG